MNKRKSNGHWKTWKNIRLALDGLIEQLGHFPTQTEMSEHGHNDLALGISRNHGGINSVRKRMGYEPKISPPGHWKEWKNVKAKLEPLIKKLGNLPSEDELKELGLGGLTTAIERYHGGRRAIRSKLSIDQVRRQDGYWIDFANIETEILRIMKEHKLDNVPSGTLLSKLGHSGLVTGIHDYHSGMREVRKKMGYESKIKPAGYWKDFEKIKKRLKVIIENNDGNFPTCSQLDDLDESSLLHGINRAHGGINSVGKKMGYEPKNKA